MPWFRRPQPPTIHEVRISVAFNARPPRQRQRAAKKHDYSLVIIPTDLMFAAWRQLFPAERMVVFGGQKTPRGTRVTSLVDVTEPRPSQAHVKACPGRMTTCLVDLERTGGHLAVWMHSHPGEGLWSTFPSDIDKNQDHDLRQHYSPHLVGIIAVRDGWLRLWGDAVSAGRVRVRWKGQGIEAHPGDPHVFRLRLS